MALQSKVKHQAYKGARLSSCLNDAPWQNKYVGIEPNVIIHKSVVQLVHTCAAETDADISITVQMLETIEINTLRKITGKRRIDHVRSQDIRQQ
jgi:hypothetical protein